LRPGWATKNQELVLKKGKKVGIGKRKEEREE
jgi:hypothetical protein